MIFIVIKNIHGVPANSIVNIRELTNCVSLRWVNVDSNSIGFFTTNDAKLMKEIIDNCEDVKDEIKESFNNFYLQAEKSLKSGCLNC